MLRDEHCHQVRMVGPIVHEHAQELKELATAQGVEGALTFVGPLPFGGRLWQEYANANVFVLPSLSEGTPKVLEAMAAGLPAVASRVGGVPDIPADGRHAVLVERGNSAQLAAALRRVLSDPNFAERLGRQARDHARSLTLERQMDRLLRFLYETFEMELPDGAA